MTSTPISDPVQVSCFDFVLPPQHIAQTPAQPRDHSRLLVYSRRHRTCLHQRFSDLPNILQPNDLLVINDTRVLPVRLFAHKPNQPSRIELLLIEESATNLWWAMVRPGKRVRPNDTLVLHVPPQRPSLICARALQKNSAGHCQFEFSGVADIRRELDAIGRIPLPPYIERPDLAPDTADRHDYQTIYARSDGSVAAPTAGLHFTPELMARLEAKGIRSTALTLHVGIGTFAPVKAEAVHEHRMHPEGFVVPPACVEAIATARRRGGRVVAVGTTSLRTLETAAARGHGTIRALSGITELFITPPSSFEAVDVLLTNFHLPRSTLLMLVAAFMAPGSDSGIRETLDLYRQAIAANYRFFSYGDAMLIL